MNTTHYEKKSEIASKGVRLMTQVLCLLCFAIAIASGCAGSSQLLGGNLQVEATPTTISMRPGETKTVRLSFSAKSPSTYPIRVNAPSLTVAPANFTADLTVEQKVDQDVQVTAPAGTPNGTYVMSVGTQLEILETVQIFVSDGIPDFTISARPLEVTVANNLFSQDVRFTVSSVNGYSGPVKITWVVDGPVSPSPDTNDFTGTVTPAAPFRFTRKMYRYATHTVAIPITFNATDVPFSQPRSVTINVKHP